jgi:hypothetical protein
MMKIQVEKGGNDYLYHTRETEEGASIHSLQQGVEEGKRNTR